jgi:hypothetical protein
MDTIRFVLIILFNLVLNLIIIRIWMGIIYYIYEKLGINDFIVNRVKKV